MSVDVGEQVMAILREAYGPLPTLRVDSPLSALNFYPSDAVVISFLAIRHNLKPPTDSDFNVIQTVGELSDVLNNARTGNASV